MGPLCVNSRNSLDVIKNIFKGFDFSGPWKYDQHNIIYELRRNKDQENEKHDMNLIVVYHANKYTWEEI